MSENRSLSEQIVAYATALRYEDIPEEALAVARNLVFDSLGTGLGGYQRPLGQKTAAFACSRLSAQEATILGAGARTTAEEAAFANGVMIKILGMDDSHRTGSHIASQVVPAVLAAAESHAVSGRRVLTAIVAAYELAVRVGKTVRVEQRRRGLDQKGTVGPMAAALAAGLCAGLDQTRLAHALGMAMDMGSGTEQYVYEGGDCDTKDLIAGFAARSGVFAANLAAAGFYGPSGALDGEYGFFRAFGDGYDSALFADLGQEFAILSTGFKPHGGCRHTHQAVDAVQNILRENDLQTADIRGIEVQTYEYALKPHFRIDPDPPSRDVAGLSIRVATALALVQGSAWPGDYSHWDDPEVRRLRRLVDLSVEPQIQADYPDRNGARVLLTMADGSRREGYVPFALGEPEAPIAQEQLRRKFDILSQDILSQTRRDAIYEMCNNLETVEDLGRLMALTAAGT